MNKFKILTYILLPLAVLPIMENLKEKINEQFF